MRHLWTFDTREKLEQISGMLEYHSVPFQIYSNKMQVDEKNGLLIYVEEKDYEDARRILINYRRKNTNRNRK